MTKEIVMGKVLENLEIAKDIFKMTIQSAKVVADAHAGQFVNVYMQDKSMLLPRPISICSMKEDTVTLVYGVVGKGTSELSTYKIGDMIKTSTSLGNGFMIEKILNELEVRTECENKVIALVGGGVGVSPLVGLARAIRDMQKNIETTRIVAIIGFQEEPFLVEELEETCNGVYITTDNGSAGFKGNVLEFIKQEKIKADYYLACGPKPMLKALVYHCEEANTPIQISMEERMGCGYGACVGCVCKTKQITKSGIELVSKKICKDGPVFLGSEVVWDGR